MVLPFVHLNIIYIEERQPAQGALFGGGPRLVFQQVSVVRLGLTPPLGHKLHTERLQAVQTQNVLGAVVFLLKDYFFM